MPRLRRRWVWLGAALGVGLASTLAALPGVVRRVAVSQIRAATGREVSIGEVDLNVFTRTLALKAFRLADRGRPEPFVQFERLTARLRLLPLFAGHVRVAEVSLEAPVVRVVRTAPRAFNFSDLIQPSATPKPPGRRGVTLTVDRFSLVGGALLVRDEAITPTQTWRVDNLSVEARDLSTRAAGTGGAVTVALKLGDTPISMKAEEVRLAPVGARVALTMRGFDLSLLLPYMPPAAPASLKSGRFSATLALDYGGSPTRVNGDARFDQLVVLRHGQAAPFASLPALTVAIKEIEATPSGLRVKRIELAADLSVLDASVSPPARLDLRAVRVALEGATWPARGPASVQIVAGLPRGGRFDARGTVRLAPVAADLRVTLGGVDLNAFQAYVPVAAQIGGRAHADLAVVAGNIVLAIALLHSLAIRYRVYRSKRSV